MRKRCPFCKNMVRMRRDGTMYKHATEPQSGMVLRMVTDKNRCPGSQITIDHAKAFVADREKRTDLWAE